MTKFLSLGTTPTVQRSMTFERVVIDGVNRAVVDGRDERSEGGAEAKSNGVAERDAKVANGEAKGEAADAP